MHRPPDSATQTAPSRASAPCAMARALPREPAPGDPAPLPRLTLRGPIPRIAGLCRAGLIYTPAPKTATYEYRAASRRRPGVLRRSLIAWVAPAAEILETG